MMLPVLSLMKTEDFLVGLLKLDDDDVRSPWLDVWCLLLLNLNSRLVRNAHFQI